MSEVLDLSNKEFVKQYVPFGAMKKVGFFSKQIKRTDYDAIVKRFCEWFGCTKRQYILSQPTFYSKVVEQFTDGYFPSTVDKDGKLVQGATFHLTKA